MSSVNYEMFIPCQSVEYLTMDLVEIMSSNTAV